MAKTTTVHRHRRARSLASRLYDPWIDGKFSDYRGNPANAPKRWKRLWARQWRYVRGVKAANRVRLWRSAQRAKARQTQGDE